MYSPSLHKYQLDGARTHHSSSHALTVEKAWSPESYYPYKRSVIQPDRCVSASTAASSSSGYGGYHQTRSPLSAFSSNNMASGQNSPQLSDTAVARKKRRMLLERTDASPAGHFSSRGAVTMMMNHHYTNFYELLRKESPPIPPLLLRNPGRKDIGPGKVKILLKVAGPQEEVGSWLTIDQRRKQVNLLDPSMMSSGTRSRSALPLAPKMFSFDSIFSPDSSQGELCSAALVDLIQAVVNGVDGCLISYGHAKLGKTYNVVGCDTSVSHAGLIPSAVAWLFRLVDEERQKSGAQYKIRISAVEVSGARETVTDLLADLALDQTPVNGGFACDDPQYSSPLLNPNQLQANNSEEAAQLLDACLATRRKSGSSSSSHMFFTLHLYQYRLDKSGAGGVSGDRSHLRLIDLGSQAGELPLSGLGNVILALINGQKHVPAKESKITQLLKDALSNVSGHTALLCHVSCAADKYSETLSVVQMASRIHKMRRKRIKTGVGYGSGDSSRLHSSSASSDPSSSEVSSATTVIFCGNRQQPESDGDSRRLPTVNRIQTNPNLKLLRMPTDSIGSPVKGAPQSMLSLTHGSPVRRPTIPQHSVSDFIEPVLRPRPVLKPILEDQPPAPRVLDSPKRFIITVQQTHTVNYENLPTHAPKTQRPALETRPTSLKVTRQTQARRAPLLGKASWTEGAIDPSKRDMIQKWVELQSPEDETRDFCDAVVPIATTNKQQSDPTDGAPVPTCDAGQQVSQLQILHETHENCPETPEPVRTSADYGISQQDLEDLDALDTLASHLSSQLDLLSVELAESFTDESQPVPHIPEPMRPLKPLEQVPVWEPKTGTFPRKQPQHAIMTDALCYTNSLKRRLAPTPPARSSSVPRQMREQLSLRNVGVKTTPRSRSVKIAKPMASPTKGSSAFVAPSPDLSQDSGHDSGFSLSSTVKVSRITAQYAVVGNKRSPSQSSSGLGSDGNSSVGSAVGKPVTSVANDPIRPAGGSMSNPGSPRRMVLHNIDEEDRIKRQAVTVDQITLLRRKQRQLKVELVATQALLGLRSLGVLENVLVEPKYYPSDHRYIPILSQSTTNLERLVAHLKSRVMLVTCL